MSTLTLIVAIILMALILWAPVQIPAVLILFILALVELVSRFAPGLKGLP